MKYDKHTFFDLKIFTEYGDSSPSLRKLFKRAISVQGDILLDEFLKAPQSDLNEIQGRQEVLKFFNEHRNIHQVVSLKIRQLEAFLHSNVAVMDGKNAVSSTQESLKYLLLHGTTLDFIKKELKNLAQVLNSINRWLIEIEKKSPPPLLQILVKRMQEIWANENLGELVAQIGKRNVARTDFQIRNEFVKQLDDFLNGFFQMDCWLTLADSFNLEDYHYPVFIDSQEVWIEVENLSHPLLAKPVSNSFVAHSRQNISFITGPNMSGKSSFLSVLGLSVWMAHLGLPVPASSMKLSVIDLLVTNFYNFENLKEGESYFKREVSRLRDLAKEVTTGAKVFVIIDELFRGTNFLDAKICSGLVINLFTNWENSAFVISSHIPESLEKIKDLNSINCLKFSAEPPISSLNFSYKLKPGVSDQSTGKILLNQSGIIDILEKKE